MEQSVSRQAFLSFFLPAAVDVLALHCSLFMEVAYFQKRKKKKNPTKLKLCIENMLHNLKQSKKEKKKKNQKLRSRN